MKLIVTGSYEESSRIAADMFEEVIINKKNPLLGCATNVIKITRHNYHPISVFIKNKDRVILFCGTMDFLSNTMKQMFSSASKSCILYLMLSYSV